MRPPFAWLGGKEKLAPWILSFFPPHVTYCEPFGGTAAVLLAKEPSRVEVWNDSHADLAAFFSVLRDPIQAPRLHALLESTEFGRDVWQWCRRRIAYGAHPKGFPQPDLYRAWSFAVVGLMAFSGNASARTPTIATPGGAGPDIMRKVIRRVDRLPELTRRLRETYIENRDALEVIRRYDGPDTLFYMDPPYPGHDVPRNYRERVDYPELLAALPSLHGMVILSGYQSAHPDGDAALPGWIRHDREVALMVNASRWASRRRRVMESIWINPAAVEARRRADTQLEFGAFA